MVLLCTLGVIVVPGLAQGLSNQSNIYIPDAITVYVDGDITNTGFIQNAGSLTLTGHWNNTNVYQGNGKVALDGKAVQTIFNNKQGIEHLVMTGGGNKLIRDKIVVSKQLDLLQGVVYVDDMDTLLLLDKAIVTVGSLSSYVDGALTAEGSGYKFFPIGKNGKYHPVEYADVKGIAPVIEVEMFEDLPVVNAPHVSLFRDVYWTRKDIQGTFISSPLSLGYKFTNDIVKTHVVVAEADELTRDFSIVEDVTVQGGDAFDKTTSAEDLTGHIFVLGESDPGYGHNILPRAFYISTSLSPRAGNPENQVIKIFGDNLVADDFFFEVYNRLSESVYFSNSLDAMSATGWDGRHKENGAILPSGAYPYLMKALDKNGKAVIKQGVISIIN